MRNDINGTILYPLLYPSPFVATLHLHRPVVGQSERRVHALAQGEGTAQGVH